MNRFEILTIIAAFLGLILSVINTGILIFKEYFKKAILSIEVEESYIREVSEGLYDIQINFICNSSHEDIYLKNAKLVSPIPVFGNYANMTEDINLYKLIERNNENLIKYSKEEYKEKIIKLFNKDSLDSIEIRDLKLDKNSQKSFTITDRVETARWPDGWEDIVCFTHWKIKIYHNNGTSEGEFDFEKK